jgi:hypothetical protein
MKEKKDKKKSLFRFFYIVDETIISIWSSGKVLMDTLYNVRGEFGNRYDSYDINEVIND